MPLTVRVAGLAELEKKLGGSLQIQPEMEGVLDTIAKRGQRQGKGLGARRNTISLSAAPLSRTLGTTLHNPRTTGRSWLSSNIRRFLPPVARNAINKMARNIAARWAA